MKKSIAKMSMLAVTAVLMFAGESSMAYSDADLKQCTVSCASDIYFDGTSFGTRYECFSNQGGDIKNYYYSVGEASDQAALEIAYADVCSGKAE